MSRIKTILVSVLMSGHLGFSAHADENFVWNPQNLQTLMAMSCADQQGRVVNQSESADLRVHSWSWIAKETQTQVKGYCGLAFDSHFRIRSSESNFSFRLDESDFSQSDDLKITGNLAGGDSAIYFKMIREPGPGTGVRFIKKVDRLTYTGAHSLEMGSAWRGLEWVRRALSVMERVNSYFSLTGSWSQSHQERTDLLGENDRFGLYLRVSSAMSNSNQQWVLVRQQNIVKGQPRPLQVEDVSSSVFLVNHLQRQVYGCSYTNEQKGISIAQCQALWSKLRF